MQDDSLNKVPNVLVINKMSIFLFKVLKKNYFLQLLTTTEQFLELTLSN